MATATKAKPLSKKAADNKANALFFAMAHNIPFSVLDLNKMMNPVRDVFMQGATEDAARLVMTAQIAKYRQDK